MLGEIQNEKKQTRRKYLYALVYIQSIDRTVMTADFSRNFDSLFEVRSVINEDCSLSLF